MKKIEIRAKTVEDAITEASLQLGVTSDKMEYEVIEEGSAGFLGIGKKDAVILACRKQEMKKAAKEAAETVKKTVEKAAEKAAEEKPKKENQKKNNKKASVKNKKKEQDKEMIPQETEEESTQAQPKKKKVITAMTEDNIKRCEEYLLSILKALGLDAQVSSKEEEDHSLYMEVTGEDMGLIIGKRGQTLDALQYLLNRVAGSHQDGSIRIKLDTEDYRERRKKTLENLARNIAAKAKKTNRSVVLEPMNPYERMIIHSTLQKDPAVTTYSKGREPYRTVVVALKK